MTIEIPKEEFEEAFMDFNCKDTQAVANAVIRWVESNTNPYIPPIILAGLEVSQETIKQAMVIVYDRLGKDKVRIWEEQIDR